MTFSEKLIALRKRDGLTQTALARSVGVTRQAVYLWEKGLSYPEAEALLGLRRLFGVPIDALLVDAIELDAATGNDAANERKPIPKAEKPAVRPTAEADREEVAKAARTQRFAGESAKTPVENAKTDDRSPETGEEPVLKPIPKPAPQSSPLRAKIEPTKKMKSGSILDLFGAFLKRKK